MRTITPLPTPPSSNDTASFDIRADAVIGALPTFVQELNDFGLDISNIGKHTFEKAEVVIKEGQKELLEQHNIYKAQIEQMIEAAQLLIAAQSAIKSDMWSTTLHSILFTIKSLIQERKEILHHRAKIGQYGLFFPLIFASRLGESGELTQKKRISTCVYVF